MAGFSAPRFFQGFFSAASLGSRSRLPSGGAVRGDVHGRTASIATFVGSHGVRGFGRRTVLEAPSSTLATASDELRVDERERDFGEAHAADAWPCR